MISKGEKEKQRKDLNKFIELNVQGINKIGLRKKGGGLLFLFPFAYHPRES